MSRHTDVKKKAHHATGGPIKCGTDLHRALEMIATEVARKIRTESSERKSTKRPVKRLNQVPENTPKN